MPLPESIYFLKCDLSQGNPSAYPRIFPRHRLPSSHSSCGCIIPQAVREWLRIIEQTEKEFQTMQDIDYSEATAPEDTG